MRALLWAAVFVVGCKGKGSTPATGSASGSGSTPVAVVVDAASAAPPVDATAAPAATLLFDDKPEDATLALAFGKAPKLPAISADGTRVADFHSDSTGPMPVQPVLVAIRALGGGKAEELELVDLALAGAAEEEWSSKPPSDAVKKTLRDRGAAILKRLDGFQSLVPVEVPVDSSGDPQPAKIGDLTFKAAGADDESLTLTLADAKGRVVRHTKVESYGEGSGDSACTFRPMFDRVFLDQANTKLYISVGFHWRDDCGAPLQRYSVWGLPTAEEDELAKLVAAQFDTSVDVDKLFATDAQLVNGSDVATDSIPYTIKAGNERYTGHEDANLEISRSRDGQTAWASLTTKLSILPQNEKGRDDPWRASSVLARTPAGWRIAATTWTAPRANAAVNKDAKAGRLPSLAAFTADPGDATLRAAFAKLATDGLDGDAASAELVAIGSGPGERTTTGATFAKGWNAGWKGKTTITSSIARLAPSGTTGWVAANVELSKGSYKIPFHVFAVFDKTQAGAWSLVHVHFSI